MKRSIFSLFIALAGGLCANSNAAPVLISHPGIAGELDASAVESVLLGKQVSIDSQRVVIVLAKENPDQEGFFKAHLGKTESQFRNHWRRLFMTGSGTAPSEVDTIDELLAKVASTPGAVAVVDDSKAGDLHILAR